MSVNKYICENYDRIKNKEITWQKLSEEINKKFNISLSSEACRKRYEANRNREVFDDVKSDRKENDEEFEEHYSNGNMSVQRKIWFEENEEKTPEIILKKFGYSPDEWELTRWRIGYHEVAIKDEEHNRVCYNVRCEMKPKLKKFATPEECVEYLKELLQKEIKPLEFEKVEHNDELDDNKMFLLPPVELHLGKFSDSFSTGFEYSTRIAVERYREITRNIIMQQDTMKCGKLVIGIGNDFFNSDTTQITTTRGTQQYNDVSWKTLFVLGTELLIEQIKTLKQHFNSIDIILNGSNHDTMSSFHLYYALEQTFKNDEQVKFSDDYTDMECYTFGNNGIWFHHGDCNLTRLVESIPVLYPMEYARCNNRILLMGHLHSNQDLKEQCGVRPMRLSSPCEPDEWHFKEKFVGSMPSQETFIFDKNGMIQHNFINFVNKKNKIKKKKMGE